MTDCDSCGSCEFPTSSLSCSGNGDRSHGCEDCHGCKDGSSSTLSCSSSSSCGGDCSSTSSVSSCGGDCSSTSSVSSCASCGGDSSCSVSDSGCSCSLSCSHLGCDECDCGDDCGCEGGKCKCERKKKCGKTCHTCHPYQTISYLPYHINEPGTFTLDRTLGWDSRVEHAIIIERVHGVKLRFAEHQINVSAATVLPVVQVRNASKVHLKGVRIEFETPEAAERIERVNVLASECVTVKYAAEL